jgi:hypothetical protein
MKLPEFELPEFEPPEFESSLDSFDLDFGLVGFGESSTSRLAHVKYRSMITGAAWRKIRNKVVAERKQCEWCASTDRLEVHHLSYDQTPENPEHDLVLLCLECHRKALLIPDLY